MAKSLTDDEFEFDPDLEMHSTDDDLLMREIYDDIESAQTRTQDLQGDYVHLETAYTIDPDSLTNADAALPNAKKSHYTVNSSSSRYSNHSDKYFNGRSHSRSKGDTLFSKGREREPKFNYLKIALIVACTLTICGILLFIYEQSNQNQHQKHNNSIDISSSVNKADGGVLDTPLDSLVSDTSTNGISDTNESSKESKMPDDTLKVIPNSFSGFLPSLPSLIPIDDANNDDLKQSSGTNINNISTNDNMSADAIHNETENEEYTSVMTVDPVVLVIASPETIKPIDSDRLDSL